MSRIQCGLLLGPVLAAAAQPAATRGTATQPGTVRATEPQRIILDTDLGDDVDDAGTLAVMHALAERRAD